MPVKLLYGNEFWEYLEQAIIQAHRHVFILSAYARQKDVDDIINIMPNIPYLIVIRDDIDLQRHHRNIIFTDKNSYHAKIYVIDNEVVIGSQNLYKVNKIRLQDKKGEVSVKFITNESINIIYQALIIILENEYENYFNELIDEEVRHYEITEKQAIDDISGSFYFKEFKSKELNNCPYCNNQIRKRIKFVRSSVSDDDDYHTIYNCTKCNFMIDIFTSAYVYDRPWEYQDSVFNFSCPKEFSTFLKLHMYLSDQIGERASFELLMSLNILGNLDKLDINKRKYNSLIS